MVNEAEMFKGRKGRKKLEALEQQIKKISDEFDNKYMHTREMKYLNEDIKWTKVSRLVFLMGERLVYFRYKGLRDYGFIRECAQWLESNRITQPEPEQVIQMLESVLPEELCIRLSEDLKTVEFI
ncbi:MAG: hypothetical protein KBS66_01100 [Eubacterium sp.]|nr:hypothetical protein [Candidatus Colimonas fimequi]